MSIKRAQVSTKLLIVLPLLVLSSCASAIKKKCDATNWYDHGTEVAHSGVRMNADTFVQQCEKAKASIDYGELDKGFKKGMSEYCVPSYAFIVGKRGDFLNLDLCDFALAKDLTKQHDAGVKFFCAKENGYPFGASGKVYNQICSPEQETTFMPEYRRGRKSYLQVVISQKNRSISDLDREVGDLDRQISSHRAEENRLERENTQLSRLRLAPEEFKKRSQQLDSDTSEQRSEISGLEYQISRKRKSQDDLRHEIEDAEKEAVSLGN